MAPAVYKPRLKPVRCLYDPTGFLDGGDCGRDLGWYSVSEFRDGLEPVPDDDDGWWDCMVFEVVDRDAGSRIVEIRGGYAVDVATEDTYVRRREPGKAACWAWVPPCEETAAAALGAAEAERRRYAEVQRLAKEVSKRRVSSEVAGHGVRV